MAQPDSLSSSFPWFGSLAYRASDTVQTITKQDRRKIQYHTLGELLIRGTAFQPLSQGGFGQFDAVSIAGGLLTDVKLARNGTSLRTVWNDAMNLSTIAPEGIDRIEVLTGSAAIGLAPTVTQTALNLQEARFDTKTFYSALWYSQGAGDAINADVTLSQNVAPGLNVNVGVRRNGAYGRYLQTDYDVWNVRLGMRYAMDPRTTLALSYHLTSHNTDLWGGIRTIYDLDALTERTTPTVFDDLRDHQRRHDVTVGSEHLLTADSAHVLSANLYLFADAMMRIRDTTLIPFTADTNKYVNYSANQIGMLIRSRHKIGNTYLRTAIGLERVQNQAAAYVEAINQIQPRVMAHLDQTLTEPLSLQMGAQLAYVGGRPIYGFGGGLTWNNNQLRARADVSYALRSPTLAEGMSLTPESTTLGLAELTYSTGRVRLIVQVYARNTNHLIVGTPLADSSQRIYSVVTTNGGFSQNNGATISAQYSASWIEVSSAVRGNLAMAGQTLLPPFMVDAIVNGVYNLGSNSLRAGFKVSAVAPGTPLRFVPLTWQSVYAGEAYHSWTWNGADVFMTAAVGNASIRISYENIFAQRWYTTSVAPYITRDLRISVTWSFLN